MPQTQLRLLPAPQPLVERLGVEWFRSIPEQPGIYRFFDELGTLLYVGKAVSLRQRLSSYRRTHGQNRRITRLIHATHHIEWQTLPDEASALALEAESILSDQPRFNRAGRWRPPPLWIRPTLTSDHVHVEWLSEPGSGVIGPFPSARRRDVRCLGTLLWLVAHPEADASSLPHSLSHPTPVESFLPLPGGPNWPAWVQGWLECQKPALLWELAALLEPRMTGFNASFIHASWERLASGSSSTMPHTAVG